MSSITNAIIALLNIVPIYTIPLIALFFGTYGTLLVIRAAAEQPKRRSSFGITLLIASIGVELLLLLAQLLTLRLGMPQGAYLVQYILPHVTLGLGIYGTVLITQSGYQQ